MKKIKISTTLLTFVTLTGCVSMAPKYVQPPAPIPATLNSTTISQSPAPEDAGKAKQTISDIAWRDYFTDEKLQKVISLAIENNRDLRVAALNIERFRALYQIRDADLLPKVDASASASFQRVPETLSSTGKSATTEQYSVGLGVSSYELDLFGRVRSLKDQALEQFLASEYAQRTVQITLVSQVANAYLSLAANNERLKLSKETLANQGKSYSLTKSRFDAGVTDALALNQAESTVNAARVNIARFTTLIAQDTNALNLLVGSQLQPELLPGGFSESLASINIVMPGQGSEILLKRPDILQSESQLKSMNANIGAARAAFFPRITLVSSVGLGSDQLSALFKSGAFAWSFIPKISIPIFDGGTNSANLKVAEIDRDIAVAQYEKTIQNAFKEVSDVFAQAATIDEQIKAQRSLVTSSSETLRLSQARFDKGVDSYLSVLDSQRSMFSAAQDLVGIRLTKLANQVNMYRVLGGIR